MVDSVGRGERPVSYGQMGGYGAAGPSVDAILAEPNFLSPAGSSRARSTFEAATGRSTSGT